MELRRPGLKLIGMALYHGLKYPGTRWEELNGKN